MKKRSLKKLVLRKSAISNFKTIDRLKGGTLSSCGILISALACTRWEGCDLHTIGHDDGPNCISQEADWCNGR